MSQCWQRAAAIYSYPQKYPQKEMPWDIGWINAYIVDMTMEIMKDVNQRREIAARYIEMHKGSANYELGFMAANVHDRFKEMLHRYKTIMSKDTYYSEVYVIDYIQTLGVIEGFYNEILHQRRLFYKVVEDLDDARRTTLDPELSGLQAMIDAGFSLPPSVLTKLGLKDMSELTKLDPEVMKKVLSGGSIVRRHFPVTPKYRVNNTRTKDKRGTMPSDYEYKKNLRKMAFEKKRGNFIPQNEGIDINLNDMI